MTDGHRAYVVALILDEITPRQASAAWGISHSAKPGAHVCCACAVAALKAVHQGRHTIGLNTCVRAVKDKVQVKDLWVHT